MQQRVRWIRKCFWSAKILQNIIWDPWINPDFIKLVWTNLTEVKFGAFELNSNCIWTTLVLKWHWISSVIFLKCFTKQIKTMCQVLELGKAPSNIEKDLNVSWATFGKIWKWIQMELKNCYDNSSPHGILQYLTMPSLRIRGESKIAWWILFYCMWAVTEKYYLESLDYFWFYKIGLNQFDRTKIWGIWIKFKLHLNYTWFEMALKIKCNILKMLYKEN